MRHNHPPDPEAEHELAALRQRVALLEESLAATQAREQMLRQQQEDYRNLVENLNDVIFTLDVHGCVTYISPAIEILSHYTISELIGCSFTDFIHPDDRAGFTTSMYHTLAGHLEPYEFRLVGKDKAVRYVRTYSRPQIKEGQVTGVTGILTDISAQKQSQEALRASEQRYRSIFEHATIGIFRSTLSGQFLDVNPALVQMLGYDTAEELLSSVGDIGRQIYVEPEQRREVVRSMLEKDSATRFENRYYRRNGEEFVAYLNLWVVRDEQGTILYLEGAVEDITERKRTEEILRQSEEQFRAFFEQAPVGIGVSRNGITLMVNAAYLRIFGYADKAEVIGQPITACIAPHEQQSILELAIRRFKGESADTQYTLTGMRKDGSMFPAICDVSRIVLMDGQPASVAFFTDITERKRMEEALLMSEERYARTISAGRVGIWDFDLALDRLYIAPGLKALLGYADDEIDNTFTSWLNCIHQDDRAQALFVTNIHLRSTASRYEIEHRMLHKDGSVLWFVSRGSITRDPQGQPVRVAGTSTDITERKAAEQQIELQLKRLHALREIDLAITASLDLRLTLNVLLKHVTIHLHIDAAAVLLLNASTQTLTCVADWGFRSSEAVKHAQLGLGEGFAGRVVIERSIVHIPALHAEEGDFPYTPNLELEGFMSYYGVPLIAKGQVRGVLELLHRRPFHPSPDEQTFVESLAGQAAIAVNNAELFDRLQRTNNTLIHSYNATIEGWARALELRDAETEGHSRRVTELTLQLAQALEYSEAELVHMRRGAILHDIGKMAIPDTILLKPGPLTDEEWDIMRQHPIYAYQLLATIPFLRPALDIPYYHHERWDGTCYPRGLKGEDIPLPARIFAVVDVWDALCSDRPYRKGWAREQVCAYMREQAGKQFDPRVVRVFLELIGEDAA